MVPIRKTLFVASLLTITVQVAMAQEQRVLGVVSDEFGPVMQATVTERDANKRIVSATTTDANGNFSLVIKNRKNKLEFSYVGSKTLSLPIGDRTQFSVTLQSASLEVKEVTVTARRRNNAGGLSIPQREVTTANQSMDFSQVEGLSFTSADEAIQGKIAGLDIVAGSGNLGSGTQMRLRGVTSINGDKNPLIVVDGQIFDAPDFDPENANEEDYAALLSVNVDDIASITVLKDGASTAVWGSRGANGVIEIKTKRGVRGPIRVAFSYKFSGAWQPSSYKLLNGDDYTMLLKEELYNPGQVSDATTHINEINYNKNWADYENWNNNTDWVKAVTQFAQTHDYNLNISGGGQKAMFRISAGYKYQTGTIIKQSFNQFTTRMALDYFVSDRIRFSTNFAFTYNNNNKNYSDLLGIAQRISPNMSIYRQNALGEDTNEYFIMNPISGVRNPSSAELGDIQALGNPVAIANLAWSRDNNYRILPNFTINYDLLGKDEDHTRLTYRGDVYLDIYARSTPSYLPAEINISKDGYMDGNYNRSYNMESNRVGYTITNDLTFTPHFNSKDLSATMMMRYQMYIGKGNQQSELDRRVPTGLTVPTLGADMLDGSTASSTYESRSQSLLYNGHVSYKDGRYSLGASLRADGNSKFGPNQKWAYFPSASGRWNISDEPFFKPLGKVISMLAVRPSWGISGNAPSSESLFYEMYNTADGYYGVGSSAQQAASLTHLKLDNLKWEKTSSFNLGFNLGLLDDRIEATLEYYKKWTTDLLMANVRVSSTTGYPSIAYDNVGEMTNEGWELNVNFNNIIKYKKFSVSAYANVSQNRNLITKMDDKVLNSVNSDWTSGNGIYMQRVQLNNPLGSIYGYRYKGVYEYGYSYLLNYQKKNGLSTDEFRSWLNDFIAAGHTIPVATDKNGQVLMRANGTPKPVVYDYSGKNYQFQGGDAIYEDVNRDGQINQLDVFYLGNSLPKIQGGFGFTFKLSSFTLRTSFNYRFGCKVVNTARMNLENMYTTYNQCASVNWRWRKDGDQTYIPRALYGNETAYNWLGSDRYVEDGSFVRFQYLQLTWDAPRKMISSMGLHALKVYLSANNLYCWTKYSGADPEHSASGWGYAVDNAKTPRAKSFTLGLNLTL